MRDIYTEKQIYINCMQTIGRILYQFDQLSYNVE